LSLLADFASPQTHPIRLESAWRPSLDGGRSSRKKGGTGACSRPPVVPLGAWSAPHESSIAGPGAGGGPQTVPGQARGPVAVPPDPIEACEEFRFGARGRRDGRSPPAELESEVRPAQSRPGPGRTNAQPGCGGATSSREPARRLVGRCVRAAVGRARPRARGGRRSLGAFRGTPPIRGAP